jgi:dTDP-4-dehydrorhamnose 3,5-epimerase
VTGVTGVTGTTGTTGMTGVTGMTVLATPLPGVVLLELVAHADARGHLIELFHQERHAALGVAAGTGFVQVNLARSVRGVVRGLHLQLTRPQGKLVSAVRGEIFDVVVDVRRGSPTFAAWFGATLSADNRRQLWIPPGFAHGYQALSDEADVVYQLTAAYAPDDERAVRWDDPALAIAWPRAAGAVVSPRDAAAPLLADAELPRYAP